MNFIYLAKGVFRKLGFIKIFIITKSIYFASQFYMHRLSKIILLFPLLVLIICGCRDDDPKPFKQKVALQIIHKWNDSLLELNKPYIWEHDFTIDTITPVTLIYHINNLSLITQDSQEIKADKPYYMVDFNLNTVFPENISFTTPKDGIKYYVNALEFTIGIADSLTNVKGLLNSIFITPMYWGMINGYINFKFEAESPQVLTNTLIYHIGGYKKPYDNSRSVRVVFDKPYYLNKENTLTLSANIFKLFKSAHQIDISKIDLIELPDANSKLIADNMAKMFGFGSFK